MSVCVFLLTGIPFTQCTPFVLCALPMTLVCMFDGEIYFKV